MEYIQAFLFTSKYLLGRNGNTDIFYVFGICVFLFYLCGHRWNKLKLIGEFSLPVLLLCMAMIIGYPWINAERTGIFAAKIVLNISIMVFVMANCRRWKIIRFVEVIVWIHAVETLIALLLPDSSLWITEVINEKGEFASRLCLFYMDAGAMAFTSGLVLVILVYEILTQEVIWRQVLGVFIMAYDLYLSYGITGIGCAFIAISAMLLMAILDKKSAENKKAVRICVAGIVVSVTATVAILLSNPVYADRIMAVLNGTDMNMKKKLFYPLENIGTVLRTTHYLGVGFGNANTDFSLALMNTVKAYPNSFLRIIAEGGVAGILLVCVCVGGLWYYSFRYGSLIDKALGLYIIIYQMAGGYFTDPTNFFIYGWIMGDCLNHKYQVFGVDRTGLFAFKPKDKLKIAMIGHKRIPSREGGVEIVVEELSRRMVRLGHQVDAYNRSGDHVSGAEYNIADYRTLKEFEGIRIIRIPTIHKKGFAALIYSFLASLVVVGGDYDIVHYHAEGPCAFLWIPSLFGIRTVSTIHGLDWRRNGKWGSAASAFIKFGEKVAAEFSDEIIVLSRHLQQYFLENYNRQTEFISNGISLPVKREDNLIRKKWGLESDGYFLFLARLTEEKGVHYLIEAFRQLDTDKKLVIAGGASDSAQYRERLRQMADGDERIVFTGFVQGEVWEELYSNAYVYCLPSDLEGMPISLLEAMSYGNCCVVSDIPECMEVVGNHAITFMQGNADSLREILTTLLEKPEMVAEYRRGTQDYICTKYQWDEVVAKTIALYQRRQEA